MNGSFREFTPRERKSADKWTKGYHARPLRYFVSDAYAGGKTYVWPVDEFIGRTPMTEDQAARLRALNPDGVIEGEYPKGWPA